MSVRRSIVAAAFAAASLVVASGCSKANAVEDKTFVYDVEFSDTVTNPETKSVSAVFRLLSYKSQAPDQTTPTSIAVQLPCNAVMESTRLSALTKLAAQPVEESMSYSYHYDNTTELRRAQLGCMDALTLAGR